MTNAVYFVNPGVTATACESWLQMRKRITQASTLP